MQITSIPDLGPELGNGSRRICYATRHDPALCIKVMRRPDSLEIPSKKLQRALRREHRWFFLNTNYMEWRYYHKVLAHLPKDLCAIYPERVDLIKTDAEGFVLLESRVHDYTGEPSKIVLEALAQPRGVSKKHEIVTAVKCLFLRLEEHAIAFYDPQNVLIQWVAPTEFQLRIVDFDPAARGGAAFFLPLCPWMRRLRLARRVKRFNRILEALI